MVCLINALKCALMDGMLKILHNFVLGLIIALLILGLILNQSIALLDAHLSR